MNFKLYQSVSEIRNRNPKIRGQRAISARFLVRWLGAVLEITEFISPQGSISRKYHGIRRLSGGITSGKNERRSMKFIEGMWSMTLILDSRISENLLMEFMVPVIFWIFRTSSGRMLRLEIERFKVSECHHESPTHSGIPLCDTLRHASNTSFRLL